MKMNVVSAPVPSWNSDGFALRRAHFLREIDRESNQRRSHFLVAHPRAGLAVAALALAITASAVALGLDLVGRQDAVHQRDVTANPIGPKPVSGSIVIASGQSGWQLLAWKSDQGICLDIADSNHYTSDCGFPVVGSGSPAAGTHELARFVSSAAGTVVVAGVAAADVARVAAVHADGTMSTTTLLDAPAGLGTPVRFFVTTNSATSNPVVALAGYSSSGALLERITAGL